MQAAEALGVSPARLLKTLMAKAGNNIVCVLAPSDKDVSLKKLAAAAKAKDAAMLPPAEAERATGYHVGGISPFGQKKRASYFIDASALAHPTVIVNGGRRGLQIELPPQELVRLLQAKASDLVS
jgi:Cys-tRNA(Pro)/Cys-tRNA(Cys) deacylase